MEFNINLTGTLDEKLSQWHQIQNKIESITGDGIRTSTKLDSLFSRRHEIESDMNRHQLVGEVISDLLIDYCLRNFPVSDEKRSFADYMPKVSRFLDYVNSVDKYILVMHGEDPVEKGIISGECIFDIFEQRRSLYVPVDSKKEFRSNRWKNERKSNKIKNLIFINNDVFKYPTTRIKPDEGYGVWESDHSGLTYFGAKEPFRETKIYIGNIPFGFRKKLKQTSIDRQAERSRTIQL